MERKGIVESTGEARKTRGGEYMEVQSKMMNGIKRYYIVQANGRWKFVKKP